MSGSGEPEERYTEEQLLPLSGLQHMVFCDRQAALIHVDGAWEDNAFTVEGSHLHRVVDEGGASGKGGVRVLRGLGLRSLRLGLVGRADVVELHPDSEGRGVRLAPGLSGHWTLRPVEYKRGRRKTHRADEVQLCAQAMCLEEQFGTSVREGDLFYSAHRRRAAVVFGEDLRALVTRVAQQFHDLVRSGTVPVRRHEAKCEQCSLLHLCMPPGRRTPPSARAFLNRWLEKELGEGAGT